jgi:integrase
MQSKIGFYLKEPTSKSDTLLFTLVYISRKQKYKFSTGIKIHPDFWNPKKQFVRSSHPHSKKLNASLKKTRADFENIILNAELQDKQITKDFLTLHSKYSGTSQANFGFDFFAVYDEFVLSKKSHCAQVSINKYNQVKKHMEGFALKRHFIFSFDSIDFSFYEQFTTYLNGDAKLFNTSAEKVIKCLKTFLNYCFEKGLHDNVTFKKFKALKDNSDEIIALSVEELAKIENLKNLSPFEIKCRDLFLILCYTGVRFSDLRMINNNRIINGFISITTQKTKDAVKIPVHKRLSDLLSTYTINGFINLPLVSNPQLNATLKDIGKLAELNDHCFKVRYKGGTAHESEKQKWELLTTHTGRRTFTTLSLFLGMDSESVKKITGHKSDKSFKKYVRYSDNQLKEKIKVWE